MVKIISLERLTTFANAFWTKCKQAFTNKIEKVKVNGTALSIDGSDKSVNIAVPQNVTDLRDNANYVTKVYVNDYAYAKNTTYNRTEIDRKLDAIPKTGFVVVSSLPAEPESGNEYKIHLVRNGGSDAENSYKEYVWKPIEGGFGWERLGDRMLDLSGYAKLNGDKSQDFKADDFYAYSVDSDNYVKGKTFEIKAINGEGSNIQMRYQGYNATANDCLLRYDFQGAGLWDPTTIVLNFSRASAKGEPQELAFLSDIPTEATEDEITALLNSLN